MRETGRVAIASVVIRSKEQLVAVRPMGDHVLGMSTMVFPDEVVDPDSIDEIAAVEDVEVTKRELDIAKQLVESLAGPFDSAKYHDTYREEVLALIERKAAGEEIAVQPAADEDEEPVPDLMAALKASLDAVRDKDADGNGGVARRRRRRPRRRPRRKPAGSRKKAPTQELAARRAAGTPTPLWPPPTVTRTPRLRRADCTGPGIARRRHGRGFRYLDEDGEPVDDAEVLARIHELVIPPAWEDVWICPYPGGHIQATGVDAAGRKQYLYHPRWRERRDMEKFEDMVVFARTLPGAAQARRRRAGRRRRAHPRARAARAPCACSTAASSASAARTTRCATRATAWRR